MEIKKHLFICTSCKGQKGEENIGLELQKELKQFTREHAPDKSIRVNKSGCLGKCKTGVNAVLYPEGKWLSHLSSEDSNTLKELLLDE